VIQLSNVHSSDTAVKGKIRLHHNILLHYMRRSHDGGGFSASAGRSWDWMRIDHNIMGNSPRFLTQGIYLDFGGNAVLDHNVVFNVSTPMGLNRYTDELGGVIGEIYVFNNTLFSTSITNRSISAAHRNPTGEGLYFKNNILGKGGISGDQNLAVLDSNIYISSGDMLNQTFVNPSERNYYLNSNSLLAIDKGIDVGVYNDLIFNSTPDVGAYEYGVDPWIAGPADVITGITLSPSDTAVYKGDTIRYRTKSFKNIIFEATPELNWSATKGARIIEPGVIVIDSAMDVTISTFFEDKIGAFAQIEVLIDNTGTEDYKMNKKNSDIRLYPNPAKDVLNIEGPSMLAVEITDLNGRRISLKQFNNPTDKWTLNLSGLRPNIYLVRINTSEETFTKRIVISK